MKTKITKLIIPHLLTNPFTHLLFVLCTLSFLLVQGCNTTEPGNKINLTLSVEDVSSTEVWLKLETENILLPVNITLLQNNNVGQVINLSKIDTTIYVDSLLPNKTYTFQTSGIGNQASGFKSNKVNVTTLDTTSNNFTWQKFVLGGDAGSCRLYDAAIINDTSIFAVGAIYLKDSTGQSDPEAYSLAIWNGKEWKLKKIYDTKNNLIPNIRGILIFSATNIWLADGGIHHWDGVSRNVSETFDRISLIGGVENYQSINKFFGINPNNIYGVGYKGMIAHYQNGSWSKIESGTDLDIQDVWGITDQNGKEIVLCPAYNFGSGGEKKLIRIQDSKIDEIPWVNRELFTVWFNTTDKIYAGGEGLFYRENDEWKEENLPAHFKFKVRGNALNDIFTVGGYGFCAHYNGKSWKTFVEVSLNGNYYGLSTKGNIVTAVGYEGTSAAIALGSR